MTAMWSNLQSIKKAALPPSVTPMTHGTSSSLSMTMMTLSLLLPDIGKSLMTKAVNLPPKKLIVDDAKDNNNPEPNNSEEEDVLMETPDETYCPGSYIDLDLFLAEWKDLFSSAAKAVVMSSHCIPNFLGSKGCSLSKEEVASMKYMCDSFKAMCVSLWLCINGINRNPGPEMSTILVHSTNSTLYMMMRLFEVHEELWMKAKFRNEYLTNYRMLDASRLQGDWLEHASQALNWIIAQKKLKKLSGGKVGQQGSGKRLGSNQQGSHGQCGCPNNNYQQSNKPAKSGGHGTGSSALRD